MPDNDTLIPVLKKLRMSGMLNTLELRIRGAVDQNLSHGEFLFRICTDEVERRDSKQLEQRVRRASFESTKPLEDFDWSFNTKIPGARIIELATCPFVARRENAILVGPTGVGKSYVAQSLGHRSRRPGPMSLTKIDPGLLR